MPWEKQLNKPGQGPGSMAETYGAGSWAVGRWPVAVNRGPVAADRGQRWPDRDGPDAQPVAVIRRTRRPDRGPRMSTGRSGSAALGSGSRTPANGQGAPAYRVKPRFPAFRRRAAPRGPRARRTGARAMFLANIYLFFRIGFNCLIFAVKIAYITCYVPRGTRLECFT